MSSALRVSFADPRITGSGGGEQLRVKWPADRFTGNVLEVFVMPGIPFKLVVAILKLVVQLLEWFMSQENPGEDVER